MIENVIDTTENCRYCLMCRHIAPLARISSDEALTPRGIALTVASQRRGLIDWTPDAIAVVFSETDGGNARAHCVFDQPHEEAIAAVRAGLVAHGLAPAAVYEAGDRLLEHGSLHNFNGRAATDTRALGEAALFTGDEALVLWPEALEAADRLLSAVGVHAVRVGEGRSNAFAAASLGFPVLAREQASSLIELILASHVERLFVLGPGDVYAFSRMYEERLGVSWPAVVAVIDLVLYLADCLATGTLRLERAADDRPWAYIDPTHAVRVPDRFDGPRNLLSAVLPGPQLELFWRRERSHPVGNTGVEIAQPELAEKLTRARLEDARASGAQIIVCEDPGTLATLKPLAAEYGLTLLGLYELLAERLVN